MSNEKQKQTYYGAIDLYAKRYPLGQTRELLVQPYKKGESLFTIAFLEYLQAQDPQCRIALIWDGARASIAHKRLKLIFLQSTKILSLMNGKLPVFDSPLTRPNKIRLKMFGCLPNVLCANFILFVPHLRLRSALAEGIAITII